MAAPGAGDPIAIRPPAALRRWAAVGAVVFAAALIWVGSAAALVVEGEVSRPEVVFDSGRPLKLKVEVAGRKAYRLRVEIVKRGSGRIVKGFTRSVRLPDRRPGRRTFRQVWADTTWAGEVASGRGLPGPDPACGR